MTTAALWAKHRGLALTIARDYWIPGADHDDVKQEALIGLWIAARQYDEQKGPFPPYARLIVQRRLWNAIKAARKRKHLFLTDAARTLDTGIMIEPSGQLQIILDLLPTLSELEREALARSLNGQPIQSKAHDNALQRARRKLRAE